MSFLRKVGISRAYTTAANTVANTVVKPSQKVADLPVLASLILSRLPIVTPELSAFEKAYYHYQDELERRLMWTFPQFFYFKKGSIAERRFAKAQRGPSSKQPGVFFPKGEPDVLFNRERRHKQELVVPGEESSSDGIFSGSSDQDSGAGTFVTNPRTTKHESDPHKLARKLDRTLYLLVKNKGTGAGQWRFPCYKLKEREPLHTAVERGLREDGGENINTWTVSNTPAAFYRQAETDITEFFIKSHVLHGQFVLQEEAKKGIEDFAWFTKDEIAEKLGSTEYYQNLEPVLNNI